MESGSLQQSKDDYKFDVLFDEMQVFRSKWIALNERCKLLEAKLHEAKIEKAQLAAKLELSREHMNRVEKEKAELSEFMLELKKDIQNNIFHKLIHTLGEKLSSLNNSIPNDSKIINNDPPRIIDDIVLSSSDDEESYANEFVESPVIGRVTDENFAVNVADMISSTSNLTANDASDHDYVSPRRKGDIDQEVEENVRRIPNNEADISNEILSTNNENISEVYPTLVSTNNNSILPENTTQQNDLFLEDETSKSNAINQVTAAVEESLNGSNSCNIRFENTETSHLNQVTVYAGNEVSTDNAGVLVENPTENISSNQTSGGERMISTRHSSSIISPVEHELSCVNNGKIAGDAHLFISSTPLPNKPPQKVNGYNNLAPSLTENYERSNNNQEISAIELLSPRFQSTNGELSPDRDISVAEKTSILSPRSTASTNNELSPSRKTNESSVATYVENTLEHIFQSDVQDSEHNSNDCDDSERNRNHEINENTSNLLQQIQISDNNTSTNDTQRIDSAASSVMVTNQPSQPVIVTNETRVENSFKTKIPQKDAIVDSSASVKSSEGHVQTSSDETSNVNGFVNHEVCLPDTIAENCPRHNQFTCESLLQQGVNHEEILPAEGDQSSNVSDTEYFDDVENDDDVVLVADNTSSNVKKSTNQEVSPEELMCQIFGSPDPDSDIVDITNESNCTIDLNLSDEEDDSRKPDPSVKQSELSVKLPRIFSLRESVHSITSDLEKDTDVEKTNTKFEPSKLKRSYSPSSCKQEPISKRSPIYESSELHQGSVQKSGSKKILKCEICKDGKEYETYTILDTHIIAKHPDPFPAYTRCRKGKGKCERHFRTTRKLNDHIQKRHVAEDSTLSTEKLPPERKFWPCTICNKVYESENDLRAHRHRTHRKPLIPRTKQRRRSFKRSPTQGYSVGECIICLNNEGSSEHFKTYQELDDHIFIKHPNPYPYYLRCPFCKNDSARHFKGLSWLNNHIANNHTEEVFQKPK